jgi:hypothetical protein
MTKPIDLLGFGPKRMEVQQADGTWKLTITPPSATGYSPSSIVLTADQYKRYRTWRDSNFLIQDALPELSPSQREILITGIGPEDWDREFGDDDDE